MGRYVGLLKSVSAGQSGPLECELKGFPAKQHEPLQGTADPRKASSSAPTLRMTSKALHNLAQPVTPVPCYSSFYITLAWSFYFCAFAPN